jgi:hypothetical protein
VEWGTPVLYLRAGDGRIFDLVGGQQPQPGPEPAPEPAPAPTPAPAPEPPQPPAPRPAVQFLKQANALMAQATGADRMLLFQQAYGLLRQANQQDPSQVEVLLSMAQCLAVLTPSDPSDETALLQRIEQLLVAPHSNNERLQLAQARFLLATSQQPPNRALLIEVREAFASLGAATWVKRCDELLGSDQPPHLPFNPIGRWRITGADGNTWLATYNLDGSFFAQLVHSLYPMQMQFAGRWVFSPFNGSLQMQGLVNGFQPYISGFFIQGPRDQGYAAVALDGTNCYLVRA